MSSEKGQIVKRENWNMIGQEFLSEFISMGQLLENMEKKLQTKQGTVDVGDVEKLHKIYQGLLGSFAETEFVLKKDIDWTKMENVQLTSHFSQDEIEALSTEDLELVQECANGLNHLFT
jgi:hypothetical protein